MGPHYALVRILAEATTLPDAAMRLPECLTFARGIRLPGSVPVVAKLPYG